MWGSSETYQHARPALSLDSTQKLIVTYVTKLGDFRHLKQCRTRLKITQQRPARGWERRDNLNPLITNQEHLDEGWVLVNGSADCHECAGCGVVPRFRFFPSWRRFPFPCALFLRFRLDWNLGWFDPGFFFRALGNLPLLAALGFFALLFQTLSFLSGVFGM